ncbi:polysaccharide lyase 8 family protein [Sphingobacterium phlebotomi]|uniref:Polysaccharide lyase 8 family protein n=1 Tax=Sphingobacterium phlebotomi TaxID=2605433 RepID=A0A5D4HAX3_9SPHI|nr:polysaccharide lyase 8 family protein [Sphingobacterium phlebotomi]TYR36969.1 polysaccharide lyase 8 family protein [Sphingobacterium phlebotomi]
MMMFDIRYIRTSVFLFFTLFSLCTYAQAEYPFGTIWKRVFDDEVNRAPSNAKKAKELLGTLQENGKWADIVYTDRTMVNWKPFTHLERVQSMVSAYVYDKSEYYGNASLLNGIVRALEQWAVNDYQSDNWWHNDIAVPKSIGVSLILMKFGPSKIPNELESQLVFHMIKGDPYTKTGANKSDIAMHYFYRALITQDKALLSSSLEQLFYPVQLVDGREGLQYDFSYLQHGPQLYIAGYGEEFLKGIAKIMSYVRDTPYQISKEKQELFKTFLVKTYLPVIRGGYIDFNVHGRGISRADILRKKKEIDVLKKMQLVDSDNEAFWTMQIARLDSTVRLGKNTEPVHKHFWKGDYTIHLRANYHVNVRMASKRTNKSETGNKENLYAKHLTDGVTNIQVFGPEYYNIFPVWEWDKIPGTTTRDKIKDEILEQQWGAPAKNGFAGGVSHAHIGVSAMKVDDDSVHAYKSWFFFGDQIVCLGAGIESAAEESVVTTLNQTWLNGPVRFDGKREIEKDSIATTLSAGSIISHADVHYYFPYDTPLKLTTKTQRGAWYHINRAGSKKEITGKVFKLWIDHGRQPQNGSYAYMVAPGASKIHKKMFEPIEIVHNTSRMQAIYNSEEEVLQIVFYEAGELKSKIGTIRTNVPILVQLKKQTDGYALSVADPYQNQQQVELAIQFANQGLSHKVTIDLPQKENKGATHTISLTNK